jgi:hypothetical protein
MGEYRAIRERMLGGSVSEDACCAVDSYLSFTQITVYLCNICAEKLKYVHTEPLEYNKCNFNSALKEASMIKRMNGAKKYA